MLEIDGELWAVEAKLTASPSPADMRRLDRVADLVGASRRWLTTQSDSVIGDEGRFVGNLGWAVERLQAGG